ncbi:hypothetical protein GWI33_013254 [Rhynchophorus ferrugineus]|uniref:C-type lectin domain-containing protein n=1 Tax=Rhynchophorus ferrugineus TaxID=354439 RepID=A0A834M6T0_RHYFE|nr:hypothetical protein GWI33_013254 [Rhynchophorus ferrugineus]
MKAGLLLLVNVLLFILDISANKYVFSNQKVTFHEAYLRCRQYGLDPAEILSEEDQKEVEEALQLHNEIDTLGGFWIFATNLADKTNYYWLNSNVPLFYSAFAPNEPNNVANKENCLEIYQRSAGLYLWNDFPCDIKLRFLCQRKKQTKACDDNNMPLI